MYSQVVRSKARDTESNAIWDYVKLISEDISSTISNLPTRPKLNIEDLMEYDYSRES
jgi:hypothetical protein